MKRLFYLFFLFTTLCLCGCRSTVPSKDYMILDEIVYIDRFPQVFTLTDGEPIDLNIIGLLDFSIHDSLLIVTTKDEGGMWSFFGLPKLNYFGKYLVKGRGPNELLSPPWVGNQHFYKEQGALFAMIYEFDTGKLYRLNISETLKSSKLSMGETENPLPRALRNFSIIDTTTFLCKEVNETYTQQIRYLLRDGKRERTQNLEKLNKAEISIDEDLNILATLIGRNPDGSRIVEAGIYLNQINLYSLDDSFGKTLCVGKRVDNIRTVEQMERWDRIRTYVSWSHVYVKFFCIIYLNDTEINYQKRTAKNSVIQFFDWNGNPLAEVRLDRMITSCDIDFIHGYLYTLDHHTEEMYRYDFSEIVEKLHL